MILYNITFKVDLDVNDHFVDWIRNRHLPACEVNDLIRGSKFLQLMNVDTSDGITYCMQYSLKDMDDYNRYIVENDRGFRNELFNNFGEQIVSFSTLLNEI